VHAARCLLKLVHILGFGLELGIIITEYVAFSSIEVSEVAVAWELTIYEHNNNPQHHEHEK
jgi:hypothetical protein